MNESSHFLKIEFSIREDNFVHELGIDDYCHEGVVHSDQLLDKLTAENFSDYLTYLKIQKLEADDSTFTDVDVRLIDINLWSYDFVGGTYLDYQSHRYCLKLSDDRLMLN